MQKKIIASLGAILMLTSFSPAFAAERVSVCGISFNKPSFVKGTIKKTSDDALSCTFSLGKWSVDVFDKKKVAKIESLTELEEVPSELDFPAASEYGLVFQNFDKLKKGVRDDQGFIQSVVPNLTAGQSDKIQEKYIKNKGKIVGAAYSRYGGFPFEVDEANDWVGSFDFFFQPSSEKLIWVTKTFDVSKDSAVKKCKCALDTVSYDDTKKMAALDKKRFSARTVAVKSLLKKWSPEITKIEAMLAGAK